MLPPPIVIAEDSTWRQLLPLAYIRPTFDLVCGMGTLLERTRRLLGAPDAHRLGGVWTRSVLAPTMAAQHRLAVNVPLMGESLVLLGHVWWRSIPTTEPNEPSWAGWCEQKGQRRLACVRLNARDAGALHGAAGPDADRWPTTLHEVAATLPARDVSAHGVALAWTWEFVLRNGEALRADWELLADSRRFAGQLDAGSNLLGVGAVHIGEGTRIKPCCVIDAEEGPVWIDRNVRVMPHCYVQGPAYIGPGTLLQPGAVVHEGTTIGPVSKVGGEIEASIILGYSNKQHDGFLGHAYLGQWINIAADCINSDLKNTYGSVRVPVNGTAVDSGEMFVGCVVGDHSKIGINVSIPTGAVIGFSSSLFTPVAPKWVPSFTWYETGNASPYDLERAVAVARTVMARRKVGLDAEGEQVLRYAHTEAGALEAR